MTAAATSDEDLIAFRCSDDSILSPSRRGDKGHDKGYASANSA